jgi:ribosomal protein S18 acetylase RimI-like enzyme
MAAAMTRGGLTAVAFNQEPGPTAALRVERLAWDSQFFGARMGRLAADGGSSLTPPAVSGALARARHDGFDHVILRVAGGDVAAIRSAESAGMRLVDVGLDLARAPETTQAEPTVRAAMESDLPWARELAAAAFVHSRFSADPFFTRQQAQAFHRQWVTNLWGGLAQFVLVAADSGRNAGFVCCSRSEQEGRIVLIATSESARGRGVGRTLVQAALARFAETDVAEARVKTQAANIAALNLYERCGFTINTCEMTYSWSRNGGQAG